MRAGTSTTEALKTTEGSRAKPAWEAGAAVLLALGITAGFIAYGRSRGPDGTLGAPESRSLTKAAATAFLHPSMAGESGMVRSTDSIMQSTGVPLRTLIAHAYGPPKLYIHWSGTRVILPPDVVDGKFDFTVTADDHSLEALQAEIKQQLGLVAHRELREADVLVLVVADPARIARAATDGGEGSDSAPGAGHFEFSGQPIDVLNDFLERTLDQPVINETELTQKFSGSLRWPSQSDRAANLKEIRTELSAQFGLELVPRREPLEMLVVEKVR